MEYRVPAFGGDCLPFTLVSAEGGRGLVKPHAIFGRQRDMNNTENLTRSGRPPVPDKGFEQWLEL